MGKFRIVNTDLGIDYTPAGDYSSDITLNVIETALEVSPFTGKRDCVLFAQYDKYNYNIKEMLATEYEDIFKFIINQIVTFYPDITLPDNMQMLVLKAKPYYYLNNNIKDACLLEMIPITYLNDVITFGGEEVTFGGETLTFGG